MPGTTIITGASDGTIDDALEAVRFLDGYERTDVISDEELHVAHTGYDAYPVRRVSVEGYTALLEGYLYGTDDVERAVATLAGHLAAGDEKAVGEWVAGRDGDFLLVVRADGDDRTWVVNDALGRLPTYRASVGGATVVTRELKVVREIAGALDPDRLGVAQMLLFGYTLGTRTLYDGVSMLPPGSVTTVGDELDVRRAHQFSFGDYHRADQSTEANARALAEEFVAACKARASVVDETVVSLSGGLDSRAVLAGYDHVDRPVVAATSANESGSNAAEVDVAREVADAVGVEWTSYVASASDRKREALLEMLQGMTRLNTALGADFVEQVSHDHPTAMFVTGDGGDKALPDLTPNATVDSIESLVRTIVKSQANFGIDEAAKTAGVSRDELVSSVAERFRGYPERDPEAKYAHFLVRERGINQLNHGEDRSRYYMWATTPFYAQPFFSQAMACPPGQKRRSRLYRSFLEALSDAAVNVDYVDFGAPINSLEYRVKKTAYDMIVERPALLAGVKRLLGRTSGGGETVVPQAIAGAFRNGDGGDPPLSTETLRRVTRNGGEFTSEQQYIVWTLVAAFGQEPGLAQAAD